MCINESNSRIIALLAQGKTLKEVANELDLQTDVIKKRLQAMRRQEGCRTTIQLVLKMISFNLLDFTAKA